MGPSGSTRFAVEDLAVRVSEYRTWRDAEFGIQTPPHGGEDLYGRGPLANGGEYRYEAGISLLVQGFPGAQFPQVRQRCRMLPRQAGRFGVVEDCRRAPACDLNGRRVVAQQVEIGEDVPSPQLEGLLIFVACERRRTDAGGFVRHNAVTAVPWNSASDHAQIAKTCPVHRHSFTIYRSNCSGGASSHCTYNLQGPLTFVPSYASNGCNVRVYLYTGPNKTGHILCINPDGFPGNATRFLERHYVWGLITSDKSRC
jgi:hypothetical protein